MGIVSNNVHPSFTHISRPERFATDTAVHEHLKAVGRENFHANLKEIDGLLAGKKWILGDDFSVVDGYALVFYREGYHHATAFTVPLTLYVFGALAVSVFEIYTTWRRTLSRVRFQRLARYVEKFLLSVERRARPRWQWLVSSVFERALAFYIAIVAAFLMLPVPFGNALPAIGISLMSVGIIERDGKAAALGAVLGLFGVLYIGIVIVIGVEALKALLGLL